MTFNFCHFFQVLVHRLKTLINKKNPQSQCMGYIVINICVRHRIFTVRDFLLVLCSCSIYILEKVTLKDHFYSALGLLVLGLYFFERKKVSNHMAISYVSIQYAAWILTSCQLPGGLHLPMKYHLSLGSNAQWVSCPVPLTRPVLFLSLMSKPPHKNAYHYTSNLRALISTAFLSNL